MSEYVMPESYAEIDELHASQVVIALVKAVQAVEQLREIAWQAESHSIEVKDQLLRKLDMQSPTELLADAQKRGTKDKNGTLTDAFWDRVLTPLGASVHAQADYARTFERDALMKLLGARIESDLESFNTDWQKQPENVALLNRRVEIWNPYDVPMVEDHARHKPHLTIPSIKDDETHSRSQLRSGLVVSGNVAAISPDVRGNITLRNIELREYEPINGKPEQRLTIDEVAERAINWIFGNFQALTRVRNASGVQMIEDRGDRLTKINGLVVVSDPNSPVFNRKYLPAAAVRVIGSE